VSFAYLTRKDTPHSAGELKLGLARRQNKCTRPAGQALFPASCCQQDEDSQRTKAIELHDLCVRRRSVLDSTSTSTMGFHLLAFVAARGLMQVFNLSAPLNLRLPLARHLPEAFAVLYGVLASHAAWVNDALARGATWRHSGSRGGVDEYVRYAMLSISD
jgi:hypothetical protein